MAKTVDGLQVYQKAMAAAAEIFALLDRPAFQRDLQLRSQLNAASIRVPSDMSEGFEQKTDRHFAKYLRDSRGGCREIRTQLALALQKRFISNAEWTNISALYEEIGKMLTGLIVYLEREDWKHRT